MSWRPECCSLCTCRGGLQRQHDIDGLAGTGLVADHASLAAVQLDQPVEQFQAPAAFIVAAGVLADRAASAIVVHLDPQATVAGRYPHPDRPPAVAYRVCDQLAAAQPPPPPLPPPAPPSHHGPALL